LLRSATSIGANICESEYSISKKDFLLKLYISLKESAEALYWIELLYDTKYIDKQTFNSLFIDCTELLKILKASTKTLKKAISNE